MAHPERRAVDWAKAAVSEEKPRAKWHRSLRMATDCSGAGTPELAWRKLEAKSAQAPQVNHIWACDIAPGPRAWIRRILPSIVLFADVVQREYLDKNSIRGEVLGADSSKKNITRAEANLDVYIARFMCSPWSPKGKREGFAAEAVRTFFNVLKTIVVMRPRCTILENVLQILDQIQELLAALKTCKDYEFKVLKFQTSNYGLPQNRERVYIVMLRRDAVVHGTRRAFSNIVRVMAACVQPAPCPWPAWLKKIGLPVSPVSAHSPALLRNRVVVVRRAADAKTFMQTSSQGLLARTIVVDVSMPADRQSSRNSRAICNVPTETFLKEKAEDIAIIPASPIVGHVLIRSCHHDVETLHKGLESTHAHRRMVCVPIDVPDYYQRYLNSAASRSYGPQEDAERSGVDFAMRTSLLMVIRFWCGFLHEVYDKPGIECTLA